MSEEFEELEHIPWAALAARTPDPRWKLALIVTAGCAVVVLALVAGKVMLAGEQAEYEVPLDVPAGTGQRLAAAPAAPASAANDPAPVQTTVVETTTAAYSEADLMAVSLDEEERLAVVWAEWFVRDYLTVDGDGAVAAAAADLFSVEYPADEPPTYVEWVEAFAVSTPAPAVYRVDVAHRVLLGGDGGYVRQPAAALAVQLAIGADGAVRLLHLPEVVSLPERTAVPVPDLTELSPAIAEAVGPLPEGASVVGGYERDSQWHVVIVGEVLPGVNRPYVVAVPQE